METFPSSQEGSSGDTQSNISVLTSSCLVSRIMRDHLEMCLFLLIVSFILLIHESDSC